MISTACDTDLESSPQPSALAESYQIEVINPVRTCSRHNVNLVYLRIQDYIPQASPQILV